MQYSAAQGYFSPEIARFCRLFAAHPQNTDAVLALIDEEVKSLVKTGVTRDEFEQTRTQIKGGYVLGQESASARMNALGRRMLLLHDTQSEDQMIERLDAVTYDSVNDALRAVLTAEPSFAFVGTAGSAR